MQVLDLKWANANIQTFSPSFNGYCWQAELAPAGAQKRFERESSRLPVSWGNRRPWLRIWVGAA